MSFKVPVPASNSFSFKVPHPKGRGRAKARSKLVDAFAALNRKLKRLRLTGADPVFYAKSMVLYYVYQGLPSDWSSERSSHTVRSA